MRVASRPRPIKDLKTPTIRASPSREPVVATDIDSRRVGGVMQAGRKDSEEFREKARALKYSFDARRHSTET